MPYSGLYRGALTTAAMLAVLFSFDGACAQAPAAKPSTVPPPAAVGLQRFDGVWIEGPGYDISYGGSYEGCSQRCLAASRCVMIEYYRPQKKCNLYDAVRPRLQGGASIVGIRASR